MSGYDGSGRVRITCSGCGSVNDITAVKLSFSEDVTCSRCHSPLGHWDVLLAEQEGCGKDRLAAPTDV